MNACFMLLCLKNWITGKPKTQFLGIPLLHGDDMSEAEVGKTVCLLLHSQTLPYGHPLKTGTPYSYGQFALSLGRESPYIFYGPVGVCIKGSLTVLQFQDKSFTSESGLWNYKHRRCKKCKVMSCKRL